MCVIFALGKDERNFAILSDKFLPKAKGMLPDKGYDGILGSLTGYRL
jgi:hypothetical protein